MATKKKMLQAAAGNAGGAGLDVEDVFSTYLYEGNSSTQTITNGIDLDGEGGLVWQKIRTGTYSHSFVDTERGGQNTLQSNGTDAQVDRGNDFITSFNSDGFSIGADALINQNGNNYASWTFRKAPKFFDVVTYTGDGTNGRQISHNLNHDVGMMLIKRTSSSDDWRVFHRSESNKYAALNTTFQFQTDGGNVFGNPSDGTATAPTSTNFTVANDSSVNGNGSTYVAYLFAHNDGDGEFGPDGDADIIKCGSYTGASSGSEPFIDLGFEPQFVITKKTSGTSDWGLHDVTRGMSLTNFQSINPNLANAEESKTYPTIVPQPTGFTPLWGNNQSNDGYSTYIYIAIRRGTKVPESATEVFAQDFLRSAEANAAGVQYYSGWPVDMSLFSGSRSSGGNHDVRSRLTGDKRMFSNATDAETSAGTPWWDTNEGWKTDSGGSLNTDALTWMWKRAPGFFDVVTYTGDGTAGRTVSHNLGVVPEMVILKNRSGTGNWATVQTNVPTMSFLNATTQGLPSSLPFTLGDDSSYIAPTSDVITVASGYHASSINYIAYLFASLPGISKVGSFTTTSGDLSVDCGFTSGARFILMKKTNLAEDWVIFDSERGIVAGNDPILTANTTAAEITNADAIDPLSSGFIVKGSFWGTNQDYIFYAIA